MNVAKNKKKLRNNIHKVYKNKKHLNKSIIQVFFFVLSFLLNYSSSNKFNVTSILSSVARE